MAFNHKSLLIRLFQYGAALALLGVLLWRANLNEVLAAFQNLTPNSIALLLLISVVLVYVSAIKWSYFLEAFGTQVRVLTLFNLYLVGYFVNLVIPSYLGGDAVRSWYVGRQTGQHEAFTATILERYTGVVAMVSLAVVFVWVVPFVTLPIKLLVVGAGLATALGTVVALSPKAIHLVERLPLGKKVAPHLHKVQEGLHLAKSDPRLLGKALLLSFLYHSLTIANTVAAGWAVGWANPPWQDLFVVVPLILLISAIPVTPGGLGFQEGVFYYFLQGVGATQAEAVGVALILRAKSYVLALAGGIGWMMVGREKGPQIQ